MSSSSNDISFDVPETNEASSHPLSESYLPTPRDQKKCSCDDHDMQNFSCQKCLKTSDSISCLVDCSIAYDFVNLSFGRFREGTLYNSTLGQALNVFDFPNVLKDLDQDLERVHKNIKSKEDHERYFNQNVNDKFKRLSTKYHPDRIKNRGGSEEDVKWATQIQQTVNLVWSILKILHRNFIDNNYVSDQNFQYSIFSPVELSILSNEERLRGLNNKILIELCWLSRIKHEEMIPNINKFLKLSYASVESFVSGNSGSFQQKRKRALVYFNLFLYGYEELIEALKKLLENCKNDADLVYLKVSVERMLVESQENVSVLRQAKSYCIHSRIKYFHPYIHINVDRYFVMPFLTYLDVLSKCNAVNEKREQAKEVSGRMRKIWVSARQHFCQVICRRDNRHFLQNFNQRDNKYEDTINCQPKTMGSNRERIQVKSDDPTTLYCLFYHLTNYYCQDEEVVPEEGINEMLRKSFNLYINIKEKDVYFMIVGILKQYAEHIKAEFQTLKAASEFFNVKEFKRDIEKAVSDFSSSMRETAEKGLQEIKEAQIRIREEFADMEARFEAKVQETEDENARRIKEMEENIRQGNEIQKQLKEELGNETQKRAQLEKEMKEKIELDAIIEEEKLRQQSKYAEKEMEDRFSRKYEEIMDLKDQLEEILELERAAV